MRRDYLIAIILALAAIPAGATLMVAPDYLHLTGAAIPLTFWGGIGLTVALIVVAAGIAWHGRTREERQTLSRYRNLPHDILLIDALWRVYVGVWGKREYMEMGADPNKKPQTLKFFDACEAIRQKAFDGELPIWATRENSQLYEPLPREFWLNRVIGASPMMLGWRDMWVEYTHALAVGEAAGFRSTEWQNFKTNKERVESLWPPKKEADV